MSLGCGVSLLTRLLLILPLAATFTVKPPNATEFHYAFSEEKDDALVVEYSEEQADSPRRLFGDYWSWVLSTFPETASHSGIHNGDDRLDSHSLDAKIRQKEFYKKFLERVKNLQQEEIDEKDRINLKILKAELQLLMKGLEYKEYVFEINNFDGSQADFEFIIKTQKFSTEDDYRRYLKRLKQLPTQVDEDIELLRTGLKEKLTHHNYSMFNVPKQIDVHLVEPEKTIYYKPLTVEKMPDTIPSETANQLRKAAVEIIVKMIQPAYRRMKEFLTVNPCFSHGQYVACFHVGKPRDLFIPMPNEVTKNIVYPRALQRTLNTKIKNDYASGVRPGIGLSSLPGGVKYYRYLLDKFTSSKTSPEKIHELGKEEVKRITKEMEKIIRGLGFNGTVREFSQNLRNNNDFRFNSIEKVYKHTRRVLFKKINPKLSEIFWKLPKLKLRVLPLPKSLAGVTAYYVPGSLRDSRPGSFVVNMAMPKYDYVTLCLHEANPGHHFQTSHFQEKDDMPEFRKNINSASHDFYAASTEGWALYAEYLGLELGLYEDPFDLFGHFSWENFRACRLVVDTGIHYFNWTKQQAIDFLLEHTAAPLENIEHEVIRYITWPAQACAYKIGEMKIRDVRRRAEEKLGENFDLRDFHETVLDCSNAPLDILEECVSTLQNT